MARRADSVVLLGPRTDLTVLNGTHQSVLVPHKPCRTPSTGDRGARGWSGPSPGRASRTDGMPRARAWSRGGSTTGRRCRLLRRGTQSPEIRSSSPARVGSVTTGSCICGRRATATGGPALRVRGSSCCTPLISEESRNSASGEPLQMFPAGATTLPSTSSPGEFIALSDSSLWSSFATNECVQLNIGIVALPAPVRVIDITSAGWSVGGYRRTARPGSSDYTTSVLTGTSGIPTQARARSRRRNFAIPGMTGALFNG
jgi:hypothetical protein